MSTPAAQPRTQSAAGHRRRTRGMALLLVVGALFILAAMAAHLVAVSEVAADEARVSAARSRLRYAAESAADRAFWLVVADRRQYSNRSLGQGQSARMDTTTEAWMTDSVPHDIVVDDFHVQAVLRDADCGLNVSDPSGAFLDTMKTLDSDWNETLSRFKDIYVDYADTNDTKRLYGHEREDYTVDGWPDLPRNGSLRCREEFLWLPDAGDLLAQFSSTATADATGAVQASATPPEPLSLDMLRLIPPEGITFPQSSQPSFFTSPPATLEKLATLTQDELALVLDARQGWMTKQTPLSDSLDAPLLQRLQRRFSFRESGVAVIQVTAFSENNDIHLQFSTTRDLRSLRAWTQGVPALVLWEELSY